MEGPSGIELHPSPPDPARLSKRAGILFLVVCGAAFGLVALGIYERGQQRFGVKASNEDARNLTAATEAGNKIASLVPERPIGNRRGAAGDDELTPPETSEAPTRQSTTPDSATAHEPTANERRLADLYQRELAALDAPTGTGGGTGTLGQSQALNPSSASSSADTLALVQAIEETKTAAARNSTTPTPVLSRGLLGGAAYSPSEEYQLQNLQDQKEGFLSAARKKAVEDYLPATRVAPVNPFVIRAGWDIPAVLEQGINSDLPGEVRALVRENVYDTASGRYVLIPQGSRLVGRYNSQVAYGQNGLQVVWERVIFPDASSIDLAGMTGQDATGRSGFRRGVDNHYARIFGFGLLTSVFGAAAQLSQSHSGSVLAYPSSGEIAASAAGQQMATLGAETTRRNLNVQPTIRIPPGYRFNVRINRDLAFEGPYRPTPDGASAPAFP
jgi:type IV secretion system protein VirB10